MKNLLLYTVYGRFRRVCNTNSEVFKFLLPYRKTPVKSISHENQKRIESKALCLQNIRQFCSDSQPKKLKLMEFDTVVWPSIIKTIKNWIFSSMIIKPYFDVGFSLPEFVLGSKQALEIVSKKLSEGDYDSLEGLVAKECLREVQSNVSSLSLAERQDLAVCAKDIYFSFPYEVGVMFDEKSGSDPGQLKRSVEITMVYHILKGYNEKMERGEHIPLNVGLLPENKHKLLVCNYRFIRDYTKGVSDEWTVNIISHFKPGEFVN